MKKIGKILYKIISFFDKYLITPITKIILKISLILKDNGKGFERLLNKKQTLIVLSLFFSFVIFFVVERNSTMIINNSAEILANQPVTAEYNEEAYVIEGLPETVDVTMIGQKAKLYLAKQFSSNLNVSVDLRDLTPGKHKVTIKTNQGVSSIDYKVDPSTATIVVYEKMSETRELDYDVLHKDSLDTKLVIENIDLSRNDCIIKGAEYKLATVATVKALVDIDNISKPKQGTIALKDVPLIAYDAKGNIVDVEIVPAKVDASIEIKSPSKTIPVKVVPEGDLAFGKSIQTIETSISTITVYGDEDILDSLEYVPIKIDVSGLSDDKEYSLNIEKPSGVRDMSSKTINVKLKIGDVEAKEITGIGITPINLDSKYKVQATSETDREVTVIVKGSPDVLEKVTKDNITATVDLKGLGPGEHEVDVKVTGEDVKATYESKTKKVKVKIFEAS